MSAFLKVTGLEFSYGEVKVCTVWTLRFLLNPFPA